MRELVVISGKGGTGKTSVTASFAALCGDCVLADCDVDAADLHLVLAPRTISRKDFSGGSRAAVDAGLCVRCGKCAELCRFDAIGGNASYGGFQVDPIACEGCGVCSRFCPAGAIRLFPAVNGECRVSDTRHGTMVHAKLGVAEENSGKLVSLVRKKARALAEEQGKSLLLIDGPPGIGCPVIASLAGADFALIVTEPTISGMHDLERVAGLLRHFQLPGAVCVNKWDLNPRAAEEIERAAEKDGLAVAGRIGYDRAVTDAQIRGLAVVEHQNGGCAADIRKLWDSVLRSLSDEIKKGTSK